MDLRNDSKTIMPATLVWRYLGDVGSICAMAMERWYSVTEMI